MLRKEQKKKPFLLFGMVAAVIIFGLCYFIVQKTNLLEAQAKGTDLSRFTDKKITMMEIVPYLGYAEMGYLVAGSEMVDLYEVATATDKAGYYALAYINNDDVIRGVEISELQKPGTYVGYKVLVNLEAFKRNVLELEITDEILIKVAICKAMDQEIADNTNTAQFIEQCKQVKEKNQLNEQEREMLEAFNEYEVEIITILSSELNKDPSLLNGVDMVFINNKSTVGMYETIRPYLKESLKGKEGEKENFFEGEYELTWEVTDYIFEQASRSENNVPVVMNSTFLETSRYSDTKSGIIVNHTYWDEAQGKRIALDTTFNSRNIVGVNNNLYKLYLMLYSRNQIDDYTANFVRSTYWANDGLSDGLFHAQKNENAQKYWTVDIFQDTVTGLDENYVNSAQGKISVLSSYNYVVFHTGYVYNSDCSLNKNLLDDKLQIGISSATLMDTTYYGNTIKFSKAVHTYFGSDKEVINSAQALQFALLGLQTSTIPEVNSDKNSVTILDLEPCSEFTLTESEFRKMLGNYAKDKTIHIVRKVSTEWNGSTEDLVGTYDLIYLGDNSGTISNNVVDSSMKGLIYTHIGDKARIWKWDPWVKVLDLQLYNLEAKNEERFSGNDISRRRMNDLKEYLSAGLPIVMDSVLYHYDTSKKIDSASYMYEFLEYARKGEYSSQCINYSMRTSSPTEYNAKIARFLYNERPGVTVTKEVVNDLLSISFTVGGSSEELQQTYTAYLYLDQDGDGKVEEEAVKKIEGCKLGNYMITCDIRSFPQSMVYQLEVVGESNSKSKSVAYGHIAQTKEVETIRVLQIAPDQGNTIDLTNDSQLITKTAKECNEFEFVFTKWTVAEFIKRYDSKHGGKSYHEGDYETDHLKEFDVIVFGFSDEFYVKNEEANEQAYDKNWGIDNANGALNNVIYSIKCGKPVIFTHGVLDDHNYQNAATKKAYDELRALAGMDRFNLTGYVEKGHDEPYVVNNRNKLYDNLIGGTLSECYAPTLLLNGYEEVQYTIDTAYKENSNTNCITKLQEGSVTNYPYIINESVIQQGVNQKKTLEYLKIAAGDGGYYQLDLEESSNIVGYYTLSDEQENGLGLYSILPNDLRDHYYLYSNCNIWYQGIGKMSLENSISSTYKEEAKLFVNTLVAAYLSGGDKPVVQFENVFSDAQGNLKQFVEFDVKASSTGEIVAYFKCEDSTEFINYLSTLITVKGKDTKKITNIYEAEADYSYSEVATSMNRVKKEQLYAVVIPGEWMEGRESITLTVKAYNGNTTGVGEVEILRRNLFDYK